MKKKLNFKSKIILLKNIVKNLESRLFENKKFYLEWILGNFQIWFEKKWLYACIYKKYTIKSGTFEVYTLLY